jgi:hypothetical protein
MKCAIHPCAERPDIDELIYGDADTVPSNR